MEKNQLKHLQDRYMIVRSADSKATALTKETQHIKGIPVFCEVAWSRNPSLESSDERRKTKSVKFTAACVTDWLQEVHAMNDVFPTTMNMLCYLLLMHSLAVWC